MHVVYSICMVNTSASLPSYNIVNYPWCCLQCMLTPPRVHLGTQTKIVIMMQRRLIKELICWTNRVSYGQVSKQSLKKQFTVMKLLIFVDNKTFYDVFCFDVAYNTPSSDIKSLFCLLFICWTWMCIPHLNNCCDSLFIIRKEYKSSLSSEPTNWSSWSWFIRETWCPPFLICQ